MAENIFWAKDDDGHVHKLQWDRECFKVTTNQYGTTGFVTVLESDSLDGNVRIHLCAHQPCTARWTCVSRYGIYGPPTHMQPHVSPPLAPPAASPEPSEPAAGTSSTAVAVEDPTPVPSSSGDTAAGTSSAAVAAENPPPAPSASDVKIPEPAPGAPNYARSQS